jgi:hypothetical protein
MALATLDLMSERIRRKRSGQFLASSFLQRLDGPRSFEEFQELFPDDLSCRRYFEALRWPRGFRCPHCDDHGTAGQSQRGLYRCDQCATVSSATTGTRLDRSRYTLRTWFRALWEVFASESATDPVALARVLAGTEVPLARVEDSIWPLLTALGELMAASSAEPLRGLVEVSKVPVAIGPGAGGERTSARHVMVAVATELRDREAGALRLSRLSVVDGVALTDFVRRVVARGSSVRTSPWRGYAGLRTHGYGHLVEPGIDEDLEGCTPHAQQLASLLRLWLYSSGGVQLERLDYYLSEFVFRYNEQTSAAPTDRGAMFRRVLRVAAGAKRLPRLKRRVG